MDGHGAFWTRAFEEHFNRLCSLVCGLLTKGNHAEAQDVVSEAFFRAMKYVKRPEAIGNLFGYLLTTARRVFLLKRSRENAPNSLSLDELHEAGLDPRVEPEVYRVLETREFEEAVRVGRGPLNRREKVLLTLHLKGYSCPEIAALLCEDARLTRTDLNAVRAKVRYRLKQL